MVATRIGQETLSTDSFDMGQINWMRKGPWKYNERIDKMHVQKNSTLFRAQSLLNIRVIKMDDSFNPITIRLFRYNLESYL